MALARIGLGSNIGDAEANVEAALVALNRAGRVVARSSLYRSEPWGVAAQPDFVNAAALLETSLSPRKLLTQLKDLERELGRVPAVRYGPRVIDLDILAYGELTVHEPDLVIPHEHLAERAFALTPLAEIDPSFREAYFALPEAARCAVQRIPAGKTRNQPPVNWDETLDRVRSAAEFCASAGLERLRIERETLSIEVRRTPRERAVQALQALGEGDSAALGVMPGTNGVVALQEPPRRVLRAEFVGIVRLSRPSVSEGSVIADDRELAYVESLGIRNPIRSGAGGRVADVFVTDGQAVEYGQPLFSIE